MSRKLSPFLAKSSFHLLVKVGTIALATFALFCQDMLVIFIDALQSETTSYLLAIPALFIYLLYRKRKVLSAVIAIENSDKSKAARQFPLICGIILVVTSILIYWNGSYTFTPIEYHMSALPIFVAGLMLIFFNFQTLLQSAFAIAFLAFLIPPPSEILYVLGAALSTISAEAANTLVNLLGIHSTITSEYGNPTITVATSAGASLNFTVDIACSGIYGLMGFLIFAIFIVYLIRDKLWKKLALIISGIPLFYILNIIRITIIVLIGYHYGEDLALHTFHLIGGWILIFIGAILLLTISEKIFKTKIFTEPLPSCSNCNPVSTLKVQFCSVCGKILKTQSISIKKFDIAKIVAITVSIILLLSIQAPIFAMTQASPAVLISTPSGQQISTEILPQVSAYLLHFAYRDTEFERKAKQDMSLVYLYTPKNESQQPIWVAIEIASTRSSLHRWETCLITWPMSKGKQPEVTQLELKDIQLTENPPIISRYFAFTYNDTNQTQAVLYWYETTAFTINSTVQIKNVKISLIAYPEEANSLAETENQLLTLGTIIQNYWQPIKTWSQITLFISQNSELPILLSIIFLLLAIILYIFEKNKEKKANTKAYLKLSKADKQIVEIIQKTEKTTAPTLNAVRETYQKITGKEITTEELIEVISKIEQTNIIEAKIANKQDEPIQTWKANINLQQK
ncbi:MAG: exosortase/archaeosortase family protein [Candidatus Bathyarchaeia archaeon]